ncbi:MAG: hypothetical protein JW947_03645 [Sedimentisphaerales bacterium]|nr:hypothetical protein [Sedimentisphaerales bacterium]
MKEKSKKGTWGVRLLINLATVALCILVFWLLGFIVEDIENIKGPDYTAIEVKHIDKNISGKKEAVDREIVELDRKLSNLHKQQTVVASSSQNLQQTINQLLELQKLSIQKEISLSDAEKENLSVSLAQFLESQKNYQVMNKNIEDLTAKKMQLEEEKLQLQQQLDSQKENAREDFEKLYQKHRFKLAVYQLLILVPLLVIAGYLLVRKRGSIYFPMFLAFGAATLLKVVFVMHEYFPSRLFKYVLIVVLLAVVVRILIYLIRTVAFPKTTLLMKQYRQAYERFLCPVCEYPIRIGPRKFLYWTRRTVHKILPHPEVMDKDETYTCPACGTALFEKCSSCQKVRHSLLVYCEHCGEHKDIK